MTNKLFEENYKKIAAGVIPRWRMAMLEPSRKKKGKALQDLVMDLSLRIARLETQLEEKQVEIDELTDAYDQAQNIGPTGPGE